MVKIDLRKLSAPVEALRPDVDAAYKRLDARWAEIAKHLKELPIPCTVGFKYSANPYSPVEYNRIEWRKWNGRRRICVVEYRTGQDEYGEFEQTESVTAYDEWSGEQRVKMLEYVPSLFEAAVEQIRSFINKTEL